MPPNVTLIEHPLARVKLARLRDERTSPREFRRNAQELAVLLAFAATRDLETAAERIRTPLTETDGTKLVRPIVVVPILRAGLGMSEAILPFLGDAAVGHIGMRRDEATHLPTSYYFNAPAQLAEADVLVVDPMLATGHSSADAITKLKHEGAKRIRFICFLAAPEGIAHLCAQHPDVAIFTSAVDERLDERAYIFPGLGDAGDRYFGTLPG
ncbi:MAG: uracil phosphoribosyltransferase [Verrucomicrobiota bacterium]|jgi:uracil phosphoribosyltransferase|nr:uracil phosphoribosyltransferase [Verrucomicrobiota bacterium]